MSVSGRRDITTTRPPLEMHSYHSFRSGWFTLWHLMGLFRPRSPRHTTKTFSTTSSKTSQNSCKKNRVATRVWVPGWSHRKDSKHSCQWRLFLATLAKIFRLPPILRLFPIFHTVNMSIDRNNADGKNWWIFFDLWRLISRLFVTWVQCTTYACVDINSYRIVYLSHP